MQTTTIQLVGGVTLDLILIKAGAFMMGSPLNEVGRDQHSDETLHKVILSKDFYMGKFGVTFDQYDEFLKNRANNKIVDPKSFSSYSAEAYDENEGRGNRPVINVSWQDAMAFCEWISLRTGKKFQLPTESQWEFACRAGSSKPYSNGDNVPPSQAEAFSNYPFYKCHKGDSSDRIFKVGTFPPNNYGLYDMHGPVGEWCLDWFGNYQTSVVIDPVGPTYGTYRVLRGCGRNSEDYRSASRGGNKPQDRFGGIGFRVVCIP